MESHKEVLKNQGTMKFFTLQTVSLQSTWMWKPMKQTMSNNSQWITRGRIIGIATPSWGTKQTSLVALDNTLLRKLVGLMLRNSHQGFKVRVEFPLLLVFLIVTHCQEHTKVFSQTKTFNLEEGWTLVNQTSLVPWTIPILTIQQHLRVSTCRTRRGLLHNCYQTLWPK